MHEIQLHSWPNAAFMLRLHYQTVCYSSKGRRSSIKQRLHSLASFGMSPKILNLRIKTHIFAEKSSEIMQFANFLNEFQVYLTICVPAHKPLALMDFPVPYKDEVTFFPKITI